MQELNTPVFSRWIAVGAITVVVLMVLQSLFLGREVVRQLDGLSTAPTDNLQWNLSQGEVEHLLLQEAVSRTRSTDDLPRLRRQFDIFYSRVATFRESALFLNLRASAKGSVLLSRVQGRLEWMIPLIDGSNADLFARIHLIEEQLAGNGSDMRELALLGVVMHAEESDAKRNQLFLILQRLTWVVMSLVTALALTALMLGRLYRRGQMLAAESSQTTARMEAMVTSSLDAILMVDTKGRIIAFNGAAETVFGYTRDEAIGRRIANLIVPDHLKRGHLNGFSRYLATGEGEIAGKGLVQLEAKRKSGELFPVELSVTPSRSGKDLVFVSYLRDISDRLAAEAELTRARDDALAGARAKANLLTVMSHEMRTPLSGILGSLELIEGTDVNAEQSRYLDAMRVSSELLLHHVNDVLELSKLESGTVSEQFQSFDLVELMEGLIESQKATARARGNSLDLRCRLGETSTVVGGARRVQQAMLNLIGNALKFTENGAVTVEVERIPGKDEVEFRVSDTGQGIEEADLKRIFEDFIMLDNSYARPNEGTGLGLAITRRIVHALGGSINAESVPGEGSMFSVTLPLPADESPSHQRDTHECETADAKRILVVEDNDINRLLIETMLHRQGHQVATASGGAEGVQALRDHSFDLVLMDISMPGMDGTEAIRHVLAENLAPDTAIVALTAHTAAEDHKRISQAGFVEIMTKPFSQADLARLITRYTKKTPEPAPLSDSSDVHQFVDALGAEKAAGFLFAYCQEMAQFTAELQVVFTLSDAHRREAHRLAGSSAVLGLSEVQAALLDIETRDESVAALRGQLDTAWIKAKPVLEPFLGTFRATGTD